MSHWGYVIEQLIAEDEKTRTARRLRRKRAQGRTRAASGSAEEVTRYRRQPRRGNLES